MILTEFGRYGEARAVAAQLQQLKGLGRGPNPALALLEYQCGHLDEALAEAQAVPPTDPKYEIMRGITALAHSTKGDFDQAIQALMCEPGVIGRSYPSIDIEKAIRTTAGAKLIELERMKLAGVFPPFRLLMRASVYLAREDFESANGVLDQAEIVMGPEPGIQALYCHHHACSLADQGKTDEVENYLERLCAIVRQLPKRSLLWESHFAAGRSYLQLGRPGAALVELIAAQQFTLHLLEKHTTAYWIARAHEAAGDWPKAMPFYQIVAADPIPSWMRKKPAEALNRHA
jgi:tetratricopeptide (TPR) repeat protein